MPFYESPTRNLYGPAPESLHPRLKQDYGEIVRNGCRVIDEADVAFIGQNLVAREIANSESFTLVQSTRPATADSIMSEGLRFNNYGGKTVDYRQAFARLYSPETTANNSQLTDEDREWWNTFALSYRYATNFPGNIGGATTPDPYYYQKNDTSRSAKVIMQFPFSGADVPPIGEPLARGTPIEERSTFNRFIAKDGRGIIVRPQFVRGVLDLGSQQFTENPKFGINSHRGLGKILHWK